MKAVGAAEAILIIIFVFTVVACALVYKGIWA